MTIDRSDLIGAWALASVTEVYDDGERKDELGPSPTGYLCYTADGFVSATLGDSTRPSSEASDPQSAIPAEYASMARKFIAYAGHYAVDETTGIVTHHMEVSLFTNWVGQAQERKVVVTGDTLTITASPRTAADGRRFHSELRWIRDDRSARAV